MKLAEDDPVHGCWDVVADDDSVWTVWCDASDLAIGVVLELHNKVIEDACWLRPKQDKRHVNVAELDSAIKGLSLVTKWKAKRVKLVTDSKTVAGWLTQVVDGTRRVRAGGLYEVLVQRRLQIVDDLIATTGLQVQVVWVPKYQNVAAKMTRVPFRCPKTSNDVAAAVPAGSAPVELAGVKQAQQNDGQVRAVMEQVSMGMPVTDDDFKAVRSQLCIKDDLLCRSVKVPADGVVLVPVLPGEMEDGVIRAAHAGSGHASWQTVYEILRQKCYFPHMAEKCQQYVSQCQQCRAANSSGSQSVSPTRHEIPGRPWSTVVMDTLELGLCRSGRFACVLVVVDVLTRWAEIVPLRRHDGPSVAEAFTELCHRWGPPDTVRIDNGSEFANAVVQSVFDAFGVTVKTGAVRHPQSQGTAERMNRTLLTMIRKLAEDSSDWLQDLPVMLHFYRPHRMTGVSPMLAMVGWEPKSIITGVTTESTVWQQPHAAPCARLRDLLDSELSKVDRQEDERDCPFRVGDSVLLKQPSRRQKRLPPFQTGWLVIKVVSPSTVVVRRQPHMGQVQEKVVNVDLLKAGGGAQAPESVIPRAEVDAEAPVPDECEAEYDPDALWLGELEATGSRDNAGGDGDRRMGLRDRQLIQPPARYRI
eukprot:scpid46649/ scgid34721/ Gag-Pol polyprotein; Matrix protein p10; p20; Capsid protein p25; Nucleocapsid protein p14; Protease p15; Reverse transcriptase/ribonuclease H p90; Integrase p46